MSDLLILIVEISAYLLALVVFGYFVYQVFFNDHARDEYKRKVETARVRRIDRRSKERPERRKKRAAMERYAIKRMRRKFKGAQKDLASKGGVDWRKMMDEDKKKRKKKDQKDKHGKDGKKGGKDKSKAKDREKEKMKRQKQKEKEKLKKKKE